MVLSGIRCPKVENPEGRSANSMLLVSGSKVNNCLCCPSEERRGAVLNKVKYEATAGAVDIVVAGCCRGSGVHTGEYDAKDVWSAIEERWAPLPFIESCCFVCCDKLNDVALCHSLEFCCGKDFENTGVFEYN